MEAISNFFSNLFANLMLPFEVSSVFSSIGSIWDAFPLAVKAVLIGIFALASFFAMLRILF